MLKFISRIFRLSSDDLFVNSRQIQKGVFYRLAGASILLAVLVGVAAYLLEMGEVTREVEQLAAEQVALTIDKSLPLIQNPNKDNVKILEDQLKADLFTGDFILLEIYTPEKEEVADAFLPGIDVIDRQAASHRKELLNEGKTVFRNFEVEERIYVQVFTSLEVEGAGHIGFLEALYIVPQARSERIFARVTHIVWFAVLVVLGTGAILYPIILRLIRNLLRYSANLTEANVGMLVSMGAAIAKRDCDTDAHNYRVTILAVNLAEQIGLSEETIRTLIVGSFLHDVGKIAIPDAILLKPGKLDDDEWKVMRTHVDHGVDVVKEHAWLAQATPVVHGHHERFDGSGYPQGVSGEDIPIVARIFSLADVFDALYSKRPYKDPFPLDKCIEIIRAGCGTHFDPQLVDPFLTVVKGFVTIDGLEKTELLKPILAGFTDKYFKIDLRID
ncbi:HD-GYP domain-containing protein [Maridesulfovibrio sp. FT414]|uniref:HD-GYP domain-containing protein n=1 Tax=Maridesulfovibrio sp. FT414 TaxID=2979469 RepID=UPI003D802A84